MAGSYEFTDAELAVLSKYSYICDPVKEGHSEPLGEALEKKQKALEKDFDKKVVQSLIDKTKANDYQIVKSVNEKNSTGFAAVAISDPEGNVTVSCRGTEGFDIFSSEDSRRDVHTDLQLGTRVEADQQKSMERFVDELEDGDYNSYTFTGHSLGGNLAMHGAITLSDPSKLNKVTTFNAPGFNPVYLNKYSWQLSRVEDRMCAYQNEYDYVSSILHTPGKIVICKSACRWGDFGFSHHMLSGFVIDGNGSFVRNSSGTKGTRTGVFGIVVNSAAGARWGLGLAFNLLTGSKPFSLAKVRDFTPEAKEMLCGAAKETEEEPWWRVTRWDCWYRIEQFFGAMEWDLYAGNVDTYYRKLIDINNASVSTIEEIFEKVYALDSSYAGQIHTQYERLSGAVLSKLQDIRSSVKPNAE